MKLKSVLDHTPAYQQVVLEQKLSIVASGKPESHQIRKYQDYTVGQMAAIEDTLRISIYTK